MNKFRYYTCWSHRDSTQQRDELRVWHATDKVGFQTTGGHTNFLTREQINDLVAFVTNAPAKFPAGIRESYD